MHFENRTERHNEAESQQFQWQNQNPHEIVGSEEVTGPQWHQCSSNCNVLKMSDDDNNNNSNGNDNNDNQNCNDGNSNRSNNGNCNNDGNDNRNNDRNDNGSCNRNRSNNKSDGNEEKEKGAIPELENCMFGCATRKDLEKNEETMEKIILCVGNDCGDASNELKCMLEKMKDPVFEEPTLGNDDDDTDDMKDTRTEKAMHGDIQYIAPPLRAPSCSQLRKSKHPS